MKRLLLITVDFPPRTGGVARYLDVLARYFFTNIQVWAAPEKGSELIDSSLPYRIERQALLFRFFWPAWIKTSIDLIRKKTTYDIILISHVLPLGTAAYVASWFTKKPYLVFLHGLDFELTQKNPVKKFLTGHILRHASCIVTNSNILQNDIRSCLPLSIPTVVVYPPLPPLGPIQTIQQPNNTFRLLTVSRLVQRKGHLRVLEALSFLLKKDPGASFHYTIIGNGPTEEKIKQAIHTFGLTSYVTLLTNQTDTQKQEHYAAADLFVMPTVADPIDREGFGIVYLEAAQHSIPSIATNLPGVDEAVLHKITGLLIPDGDICALSDAIETLLRDPVLRKTLGDAARKRTQEEFTAEKQFGKLRAYL